MTTFVLGRKLVSRRSTCALTMFPWRINILLVAELFSSSCQEGEETSANRSLTNDGS